MDNNQRGTPRPPIRDQSTKTGSPTSASARQLARKKGLARISAITVGAGAAGLVGAVAIAMTLPNAAAATSATTAALAASTSTNASWTRQAATVKAAALQAAAAPTTTTSAPVATSGAS
jgi:Zn finger protein HypA/HybF involved in hydrogenase expression